MVKAGEDELCCDWDDEDEEDDDDDGAVTDTTVGVVVVVCGLCGGIVSHSLLFPLLFISSIPLFIVLLYIYVMVVVEYILLCI